MTIDFYRLNRVLVTFMICSFIFPAIHFFIALRVDQLLAYVIFLLNIIHFSFDPQRFLISKRNFWIIIFFLALVLLALLSSLINGIGINTQILAALDNLLNPAVITFFLIVLLSHRKYEPLRFQYVVNCIVYFLVINSCFSLLSMFIDVTWFVNSYYGSGDPDASSVWQRSYVLNRFIGFFSQPFEAGLAYSSGLLIFLRGFSLKNKLNYWIIGCTIVLGGIISTSKVFYLTGFMIVLFEIFKNNLKVLAIFFILFIGFIYNLLIDAIQFLLYSRYVETSNFIDDVMHIWNANSLLGLGLVSSVSDNALDNAYLQIFMFSGLSGVIIYLILLIRMRPAVTSNLRHRSFNLIFLVLLVLGGLGSPTITANKANFFLLFYSVYYGRRGQLQQ